MEVESSVRDTDDILIKEHRSSWIISIITNTINQLASGLRSAFLPTVSLVNPDSSFLTRKEGLSWLKLLVNLALAVLRYVNYFCLICSFQTAESLYILPINLICNRG